MKLLKLLNCDTYRDGGSIEGIWLSDENEEWAVTLCFHNWFGGAEKEYHLYNSRRNNVDQNVRILKNSSEHLQIVKLINNWVTENNIRLEALEMKRMDDFGLYHLLNELEEGNY